MVVEPQYEEIYRFRFTEADCRQLHQIRMQPVYVRLVLFGLLSLYFLFISSYQKSTSGYIFLGAGLVMCVAYVFMIAAGHKSLKEERKRASETEFEYVFGSDSFLTRGFHGEEKVSEIRYTYTEITKIYRQEDWLVIQTGARIVPVRKSQLVPNSVLFSYLYQNLHKVKDVKKMDRWWVASIAVFVASLASVWIALVLSVAASEPDEHFVHKTWLFYLVTPIPLSSVILSFVLKRKGRKYKKNLIAGIIVTVLLCIYGSFSFIFKDAPREIVIPEAHQENHQKYTK